MSSRRPDPFGAARLGTWLKDKYRLDRILGEGGMATVYAATHRNKKRFAVKMLHSNYSANRDIRARFLREGYVANTVEHPGAVAVLDDDVAEDGSAFLVMELLEGYTAERFCEELGGRLDPRTTLAIGFQLLDVLVAAHDKGVVHRDIKPANLFLTHAGVVKVLDFGIARLREGDDSSSTRTGVHLGTPAFMSPEQANGRTSLIDPRSDLWSVGATLYSFLTQRNVHQGESAQHVVMLTATTQAESIAVTLPRLPVDVVSLIDRALLLDRDRRWPDARAMREAVAAALTSLTGQRVTQALAAEILQVAAPPSLSRLSAGSMAIDPTLSSDLRPPPAPTRPATPIHAPSSAPPVPVAAGSGGSTPSVSVTSPSPRAGATTPLPVAARSEVVHRTMDPVSSSPSPQARRGRRIAFGAGAGVVLLGAGVVLGLSLRAAPGPRASASAPSPAPSPSSTSPATASPGETPAPGPAPVVPPTGVAEPAEAPDAAAHDTTKKPSDARGTVKATKPASSARPGASDFDRQ